MDRLLQLVLVLTIATSSYCSVFHRHKPEMRDTVPEFKSDDNYPTAYIEALVDALNPEELQRLRSVIDLHHRTGAPSSSRCSTYNHTRSPHEITDEFGTSYYIITHTEKLPKIEINIEVCDYKKNGYNCITEEGDKRPTYANCCVNVKEMMTMNVLAIPALEFQASYNKNKKIDGRIIQKNFYISTRCDCEIKALSKKHLENNTDVCQLSDNNLLD